MSLLTKIINYMKLSTNNEANLEDLYKHFKDEKTSTVRGRINEVVGSRIIRTGRGKYILAGVEVEAIIEQGDSRIAMPNIIKANIFYDLIFIDPPYKTNGGQKGGNRDLSPYPLIDPEEFQEIVKQAEKMLRTEDSQLYFMITSGKTSKVAANKYIRAFEDTSLQLAAKGSYTKLNKNLSRCNMGKHLLPTEDIFIYSPSGKLVREDEVQLDFELIRPSLPRAGGYPTEKPLELLKQIVKQSTRLGDNVLDFFGGSGVTLEASLMLKRFIHTMDISEESVKRILKKVEQFVTNIAMANSFGYVKDKQKSLQMEMIF